MTSSSRDDDTAALGASPPPRPSFESSTSASNTNNNAATYASGAPVTVAAFSPVTLSANTPSRSARRSTVLVHQKSPLLLATPPQITRALAYSHPFILPLNTFVGLVTWSSGDPWQSFLLLCAFWAIVLYGDVVVRWAGPVVVGIGLIVGMYGRRYSPLSSSGWNEPARDPKTASSGGASAAPGSTTTSTNQAKSTISAGTGTGAPASASSKAPAAGGNEKTKNQKQQQQQQQKHHHQRGLSEVTNTKHQKTLDEIVETLKELTGRCNVLMEPLLEMTDFLSTQRTATSATTRPALTAMFVRLLIVTPFWIALTMPPWRVVTTRRVMLVAGTLVLTWHARVMRVTRALLWRSATIRSLASAITGLEFPQPIKGGLGSVKGGAKRPESELTKGLRKSSLQVYSGRQRGKATAGVKFTFIIYENQRRWIGLGWTSSLFTYERGAWTDEHNNPVPPKDEFELPEVEDGSSMEWRWVEGSRWRVDGVIDEDNTTLDYDGEKGRNGWVYYDNKVRLPSPSRSSRANHENSGRTGAEVKTAGLGGHGAESGIAMPSSWRGTLRMTRTSLTNSMAPFPYLPRHIARQMRRWWRSCDRSPPSRW